MDITPIITAVIAAVITGCYAVLATVISVFLKEYMKTTPREKLRKKQLLRKIQVTILAIALLTAAFFVVVSVILNPQEAPKPYVKITYPTYGNNVTINELVQGTSTNIPKGATIWVIVDVPNLNRYYPMAHSATIEWNGQWSCQTTLGRDIDTGGQFDIMAIVADSTAQGEINTYLTHITNPATNNYPGMTQIPNGLAYDMVRVTRSP